MRKKDLDKKSVTRPAAHRAERRSPGELKTDREYWRKEFMDHRSELLFYAIKLFRGDTSRAESILQDVFVRLDRYSPRRKAVNSPTAYLMTMVRRLTNDSDRKLHYESLDDPEFRPHGQHETIDPVIQKLEESELLDYLGSDLDWDAQQVYELLRQDLSTREIAEKLSMPIAKVQRIKRTIIFQLRKRISKSIDLTNARIAKDKEEIDLLKKETRQVLERLRAA